MVITVFSETDALSLAPALFGQDKDEDDHRSALAFNLYCSKLSESVDVDLPHAMQKMIIGEVLCIRITITNFDIVEHRRGTSGKLKLQLRLFARSSVP